MTTPTPEGASSAPPRGTEPKAGRKMWRGLREVAIVAVSALVISFLIKTFLMQAFWIPSGSMEDTLRIGDRVLVSKIEAGSLGVERGDIVVFEDPGGWLPPAVETSRGPVLSNARDALEFIGIVPAASSNHLIKRVIAQGGDEVQCCDEQGRLLVNGVALEESYLFPGDEPSDEEFEITVPADHYWVMGDHRSNSRDSRANDDGTGQGGSIPAESVVGQAFVLVWPLDHWDWLSTPETFNDLSASEVAR